MIDLLPDTRIERRNYRMKVHAIYGYPSTIYIQFWKNLEFSDFGNGINLYRVVGHSGKEYGFFDWHPTKESILALLERSMRLVHPENYARYIEEGKVEVELF